MARRQSSDKDEARKVFSLAEARYKGYKIRLSTSTGQFRTDLPSGYIQEHDLDKLLKKIDRVFRKASKVDKRVLYRGFSGYQDATINSINAQREVNITIHRSVPGISKAQRKKLKMYETNRHLFEPTEQNKKLFDKLDTFKARIDKIQDQAKEVRKKLVPVNIEGLISPEEEKADAD